MQSHRMIRRVGSATKRALQASVVETQVGERIEVETEFGSRAGCRFVSFRAEGEKCNCIGFREAKSRGICISAT